MGTRSNNLLVGIVTLLLIGLVLGFTVWLARAGQGDQKEYDIFFAQSVSGLAKGSGVLYSGVPVGEVRQIELWEKDPEFVRVRISIKGNTPVLQGTAASILSGFTGVSQIQLAGGSKGAPAIAVNGPEGVPVIPTKPGALGELLNNAPLLLERLSTLTERLTNLVSDDNQQSIGAILDNTEQITGNTAKLTATLGKQEPLLIETMQDTRKAVAKAGLAADEIAQLAGNADVMLNQDGRNLFAQLGSTLEQANKTLDSAEKSLARVGPAVDNVTGETLPEVNALVKDLRETNKNLNAITGRINDKGVGSLIGQGGLPDYEP